MKNCIYGRCLPLAAVLAIVCGTGVRAEEAACGSAGDPVQTYMSFHDELPKATSLDQLQKYVSQSRWEMMSKDQKTMPREEFEMMFQFFKKLSPDTVTLVGKSQQDDQCTLNLTGHTAGDPADLKTTGKVTMKIEGGAWKIEKEEWQASQVPEQK